MIRVIKNAAGTYDDDDAMADAFAERMKNPPSPEEIQTLVNEGWTPGRDGKAIERLSDGYRWEWNVDQFGSPHHYDVERAIPAARGKEIIINRDGKEWSLEDDPDPTVGWTPTEESWTFSRSVPEARWQWMPPSMTTTY
jgi:hypothetical protein